MRRGVVVALAALMVVGALLYAGYQRFARSAHDDAVEELVVKADQAADEGAAVLGAADSTDRARARLQDNPDVFAVRTTADGTVEWDLLLNAVGSDRSAWSYSSLHARACVRFTGRLGARSGVTRANIDCPARLDTDPRWNHEPYDETVTLPPKAG